MKTKYEITNDLEATSVGLAQVFIDLYNCAEQVQRYMTTLSSIVEKNRVEFNKTQHVFYKNGTASAAMDFERTLAKYEAIEHTFFYMGYAAGLKQEELTNMVSVAREKK